MSHVGFVTLRHRDVGHHRAYPQPFRNPSRAISARMNDLAALVSPEHIAAAKALVTDPAMPSRLWAFVSDPGNIAAALVMINFLAFAAFGIDKARAERGAWRISEGALLRLAFFGGTLGAYAGRALFRHKTRKQPFCANLHTIAVLQVIAAGLVLGYYRFGDTLDLGALVERVALTIPMQAAAAALAG
jgi:uncharacterized membrane protein YsdA (DUF1294 family)